eukprot:TRINITY_DN1678_c0_g1_i1.p1 TRINITY_DN1678_c0_g1~~TRINITY_DN1678_c0_g1_i1.p1  ORF type:complete len:295 (-),score=76.26 TRINITY_DN1678_c0_g1_i1:41-925(-)
MASYTGQTITPEKKRKHKITEQKGRQKINDQINELKNLLPECKYVITTKASVLECAVKSIHKLNATINSLSNVNKNLQRDNKRLQQELARLSPHSSLSSIGSGSGSGSEDSPNLSPTLSPNLSPNLSPEMRIPEFPDLSQVDGLYCEPDMDGQFLTEYDYSSPGSTPPPFGSDPDDYLNDDDGFYKVSKRRLMLVFLFMLPFFLGIDSMVEITKGASAPGRGMLNKDDTISMDTSSPYTYYFDVAKVVWYAILGLIAMSWLSNMLMWVHGLGKHSSKISSQFQRAFLISEKSLD